MKYPFFEDVEFKLLLNKLRNKSRYDNNVYFPGYISLNRYNPKDLHDIIDYVRGNHLYLVSIDDDALAMEIDHYIQSLDEKERNGGKGTLPSLWDGAIEFVKLIYFIE